MIIAPGDGSSPSERRDATFTGEVWATPVVSAPGQAMINSIFFAPGARTFWHRHEGGQMLIGYAGAGLVVTRDAVAGIGEGAVVHAFAGEEHWHGALPDSFMSHQSIVLGGSTEWLEEVSDQEYLAAIARLTATRPGERRPAPAA